jgi:outer membrane biosynthesis protein TonB
MAFGVSVLLHVILALVTWKIPLSPVVDEAMADEMAREVELVLVEDEQMTAQEDEMPSAFTSVPERLASEVPPEDPDYLAMYHALAADNKLGGESNTPAADVESDFNQVEIKEEELDGAEGVEFSQQPLPRPEPATSAEVTGVEGEDQKKLEGETLDPSGEWALPSEKAEAGGESEGEESDRKTQENANLEDWWGGEAPSILKEGKEGSAGDRGFKFDQEALGRTQAGVALDGEFSLSTYQWDYAPWLRYFANELYRHWIPPYAYRLGVIDGWTEVLIVIGKDGRVQKMEVQDTQGHQSLHDASVAALRAFAPYTPLPAHFPEDVLVITLRLGYPPLRR